jgi:hypothetical protein
MTTTTIPHSAPTGRGDALHTLAVQLYGLLSSGHDALAWNVDARGPALTMKDPDGKRRPVPTGGTGLGAGAPAWQRARELVEGGAEVDRRFNPWVLERHLRGKYSVAPAAPGWVQWVALDIDAHPAPGEPELPARRLAKARADRVLAGVWRAFHCSAERHPLVLRSPGGGYHVWFPLTRGPSSSNPEHTWPALVARAWFERHLMAAGLELAPGVLEVFPSGRCLRAPCGHGQQVLQAEQPDDPDALRLVPWPGTMANEERVDWLGQRPTLSAPVRRVVPMVQTFVAQWDAQRRTLADWLGRPEASWDPAWGFLGWRSEEIPPPKTEKKMGVIPPGKDVRSQESVDVPGRPRAGGISPMPGGMAGDIWGHVGTRSRSGSGIPEESIPPTAPRVDVPPVHADGTVVRGRAFKEKVRRLLSDGITEPSTRHDAVLTLSFYWAATCGLGEVGALARLEAWCKAHPHAGSRLASRPRLFHETCLREARHYIVHHGPRWRFRGRGDGGGLATLTVADQAVVAAIDPRVRGEACAILAWLAGRVDGEGRLGEPVQISTGLLARLCGDRRIDDEAGRRRRSTTLALEELERLGVLTMAHNYRVGQRGRMWSCWYQFGSGELPRTVEMSAADWAALGPAASPAPEVAPLALVPRVDPPRAGPPAAAPPAAASDAIASSSPDVVLRVVGERAIPEGVVRVLSDGERGLPRTLLALAPDVARPTAAPSVRVPWFVRPFQARTFTPAELRSVNAATVIPFPDVAARRRMTRTERLAWGGALAEVPPRRAAPPQGTASLAPELATPASRVPPASLAPELATSASRVPPELAPRMSAMSPASPASPAFPASSESPPSPELRVSVVSPASPAFPASSGSPPSPESRVSLESRESPAEEPAALRAELAAEVGTAAAALPLDLVDVVAHAWRAFRRGRDP